MVDEMERETETRKGEEWGEKRKEEREMKGKIFTSRLYRRRRDFARAGRGFEHDTRRLPSEPTAHPTTILRRGHQVWCG